jgi:hypothetical protein
MKPRMKMITDANEVETLPLSHHGKMQQAAGLPALFDCSVS